MNREYVFIDNPKEFHADLILAIRSAKSSIKLQFMTYEADNAGLPITKELIAAAKRGINVEVMADAITYWKNGSSWFFQELFIPKKKKDEYKEFLSTKKMFENLMNSNVKFKITNPIRINNFLSLFNGRCHKKIVVIDNKIAYIGGVNLADHNLEWNDTVTKISNVALVNAISEIFTEKFERNYFNKSMIEVSKSVEIFQQTGPLVKRITGLIRNANNHIFLESPYFMSKVLLETAHEKYKTRTKGFFMLSTDNDQDFIRKLHDSYEKKYSYILRRKRPTSFSHAKLALIDNTVVIGSDNFLDNKLLYNHEEIALVINNEDLANQLYKYFQKSKELNS